jgi:hypothetical protein
VIERRLHRGREPEAAAADVAANEIREAWLVDRDDASLELLDPVGVDVDEQDLVSEIAQARARDEAYVASSKDDETHAIVASSSTLPLASEQGAGLSNARTAMQAAA